MTGNTTAAMAYRAVQYTRFHQSNHETAVTGTVTSQKRRRGPIGN